MLNIELHSNHSFNTKMLYIMLRIFPFLLLLSSSNSFEENSTTSLGSEDLASGRILSRQKRFLVFPDGSSFQLVFCTQTHGYLQVGDIVWFGNTAALAWELPTDLKLFYLVKGHEKDFIQNRNGVNKSIYLLDEDGKVLKKVPFRKKIIVNPAFAKRSAKPPSGYIDTTSIKYMHSRAVNHFKHLDHSSIEFHRRTRKDFYTKLQTFFTVLGYKGPECVLRMLCETGKGRAIQGTFFEEIMRATFTFPSANSLHTHFDKAYTTTENCGILYPNCKMIE